MTHLWCILVPFGAYFTVSGIPCFQCSKNTWSDDENGMFGAFRSSKDNKHTFKIAF